jgi:hypothetical protein
MAEPISLPTPDSSSGINSACLYPIGSDGKISPIPTLTFSGKNSESLNKSAVVTFTFPQIRLIVTYNIVTGTPFSEIIMILIRSFLSEQGFTALPKDVSLLYNGTRIPGEAIFDDSYTTPNASPPSAAFFGVVISPPKEVLMNNEKVSTDVKLLTHLPADVNPAQVHSCFLLFSSSYPIMENRSTGPLLTSIYPYCRRYPFATL